MSSPDSPLITDACIVRADARDLLFVRCGTCTSKLVSISQHGDSILYYCARCQTIVNNFKASFAAEILVHANGVLQQYKVHDALEPLLGCDAATFSQILTAHPDVGEHVGERLEGLMCHLAVRQPKQGKPANGPQVVESIIPISIMEPILKPMLSQYQDEDSDEARNEA